MEGTPSGFTTGHRGILLNVLGSLERTKPDDVASEQARIAIYQALEEIDRLRALEVEHAQLKVAYAATATAAQAPTQTINVNVDVRAAIELIEKQHIQQLHLARKGGFEAGRSAGALALIKKIVAEVTPDKRKTGVEGDDDTFAGYSVTEDLLRELADGI